MANALFCNVYDIANQLRQEQLLITSEKKAFGLLKQELYLKSFEIQKLAWISSRQRQNLSNMIIAKADVSPTVCSKRSIQLENSQFLDVHALKSIKHQCLSKLIDLLAFLKNSPFFLGECMAIADQINQIIPSQNESIVQIICDGLYGSLIRETDVDAFVCILDRLIDLQLVNNENCRQMLRPGACSFSRLFQKMHESMSSAKLFLVASMYDPVMAVLIGENKSEGKQNASPEERIYFLASKFLKSLTENWELFPTTIKGLVRKLYSRLQQNNVPDREIMILISDLVFTYFICGALVNPDLFGISNIQVDTVARHNLIQIGQIIQKLALSNYEPVIDDRNQVLYEKFESEVVHKLLLQLISNENNSPLSVNVCGLPRDKLFVTRSELNLMLDFLRTIIENDGFTLNPEDRKQLGTILEDLPIRIDQILLNDNEIEFQNKNRHLAISSLKKTKITKPSGSDGEQQVNVELIQAPIETRASSFINGNIIRYGFSEKVLVFPIKNSEYDQSFHLYSEEEIAETEKLKNSAHDNKLEDLTLCNEVKTIRSENDDDALLNSAEKENRWMMDNMEAASEAASNHSTSSLDLEENDQNDNLSDMVSANVSGRGSPNISGRDTPSSQVTENSNNPIPAPQMAQILSKNRSDIQDKFCKFEIKKLIEGDETISIISDTWSTDVLASDSEAVETNERNFATPLIPANVILPGDSNYDPTQFRLGSSCNAIDISETQSESAWSTDVLGSDSEKVNEIDFDLIENGAASLSLRAPDSPFFTRKIPKVNTNSNVTTTTLLTPESPFSTKSYDESPKLFDETKFCNSEKFGKLQQETNYIKTNREENLIDVNPLRHTQTYIQRLSNVNEMNIVKSDPNIVNPFFDEFVTKRNNPYDQKEENSNERRNGVIGMPQSIDLGAELSKADDGRLGAQSSRDLLKSQCVNSVKQSRSTGAIPKSISFDSSADKAQQQNRRSGLLNKIKGLANIKGRKTRGMNNEEPVNTCNDFHSSNIQNEVFDTDETTDDILGKYRRKISTSSDPATSDSTGSNSSSSMKSKSSQSDIVLKRSVQVNQQFQEVREKVKNILSKTKTPLSNISQNCSNSALPTITYLRCQRSDAIMSQNLQHHSYTSEGLRCLGNLQSITHVKLLQEMQIDLADRQKYSQYLLTRRKRLLVSLENIQSLEERIRDEQKLYMQQLVLISLKMFLEKHVVQMTRFYEELGSLTISDEKIEILGEHLKVLMLALQEDDAFKDIISVQGDLIRDTMEMLIIQHVYPQLLFPNDDVDRSRDLVLQEHLRKLSKIITPTHKLLRIPSKFLSEAPWPLAQEQILQMTAYKMPKEKVLCVVRTCLCIMNLLTITNQAPAAADDLTPVLIFVIIKANPPNLLSTIQFVNSFIGDNLEGEESYWWTQFVTCVEFIKTMD